jgi:hypothetical protein
MDDVRPRATARAQFQRFQVALSNHTGSLSFFGGAARKTSVANAQRRSRSWPDLSWARPPTLTMSPGDRRPRRAPRSRALEKEDRKEVLTQRLAHGSPPHRARIGTARWGVSGEKGMSCEPRYNGKSFFSQSMLGMKWFLGGITGTKTFYFCMGVVTECLSICSRICTSEKQSDKRLIDSSTRKLTNCPHNCLRPLASLLKTKCFFCFF